MIPLSNQYLEISDLKERVTAVETDVTHMKENVCELRAESKTYNKIVIFLLSVVLGVQGLGLI